MGHNNHMVSLIKRNIYGKMGKRKQYVHEFMEAGSYKEKKKWENEFLMTL